MAPQQTFYGSVTMEKEEAPKRSVLKAVAVAAGVLLVVSVGVFAMQTAPVEESFVASTASVSIKRANRPPFRGDDIKRWGPDCVCALGSCPATPDSSGAGKGKHYCAVKNVNCMGADYGPVVAVTTYASLKGKVSTNCATTGKNDGNAPCRAVCDFIQGRDQCANWPCVNGGYCVDGVNAYKCHCRTGFTGVNCELDINECDLEDSTAKKTKAVCHANARCTNSKGAYSCKCNAGYEGLGYRAKAVVPVPAWMTVAEAAAPASGPKQYGCNDINDCAVQRCQNGGTCINSIGIVNGWSCKCRKGITGKALAFIGDKDCYKDKNECKTNEHDCSPNAKCHNNVGGFTCKCGEHWQPTDPCNQNHKGRRIQVAKAADKCKNPQNKFYTQGCYDIDDCASKPCKNGGTCTEGKPGCRDPVSGKPVPCFFCTCKAGWSGVTCEKDENECLDSEKGKGGNAPKALCRHLDSSLCTNTDGSYACSCKLGYTGTGLVCWDADDCEYSPCAHGGTCTDCGTLCFVCDCVRGWRGTTCQTDWNECLMGIHNCNDAATCLNTPGSYTCRCDSGYEGDGYGGTAKVEETYTVGGVAKKKWVLKGCHDIDDCQTKLYRGTSRIKGWSESWQHGPCKYGTCTNTGPNLYNCECHSGYEDSNCDHNIDECDSRVGTNDCSPFATCKNTAPTKAKGWADKFTCSCNKGFQGNGMACQDIGDCHKNTCNNHGFCADLGASQFRCTCDNGWSDATCNQDVNECAGLQDLCKKNAHCINTKGSYICKCNAGFQGDGTKNPSCTAINDCAKNPCKNGKCSDDGVNIYSCKCNAGWTDYNCDFDIDECVVSHNCWQGATSSEEHHKYVGGAGLALPPAKCVNTEGSYECRCENGMIGTAIKSSLTENIKKSFKWSKDKTKARMPKGCVDINDCNGPGKDLIHGTADDKQLNRCGARGKCQDKGAGKYRCKCDPGYGCNAFNNCDTDCDECALGTHTCSKNAACTNTEGAYTCQCNYPVGHGAGFFGNGFKCSPCTVCGVGYSSVGICKDKDRSCRDIDECASKTDKCDVNAACTNTDGSYTCQCRPDASGRKYFSKVVVLPGRARTIGTGANKQPGCTACTICYAGFHEVSPCTPTKDRVCARDVSSAFVPNRSRVPGKLPVPFDSNGGTGATVIVTEADDNARCLTVAAGDWYPTRVDFNHGNYMCGMNKGLLARDRVKFWGTYSSVIWYIVGLGDNSKVDFTRGESDLYLIRANGKRGPCLFFGDHGKDVYPSLQHCKDYEKGKACPWKKGGTDYQSYCGYTVPGATRRQGLLKNMQAVWKISTIKLNSRKFIIQSAANRNPTGVRKYECLIFDKQGAATNPSRYNWGNGNSFCGVGNWGGHAKDMALLNNKQAIFILEAVL
jgi:hypothetical protein